MHFSHLLTAFLLPLIVAANSNNGSEHWGDWEWPSPVTLLPSSCQTACSAVSTFWDNWDWRSDYQSSWSDFCENPTSTDEASSCASCYSSAYSSIAASTDLWGGWRGGRGWGKYWGAEGPAEWCSLWSGSGISRTWTSYATTTDSNSETITTPASTITQLLRAGSSETAAAATASASGTGTAAAATNTSAASNVKPGAFFALIAALCVGIFA